VHLIQHALGEHPVLLGLGAERVEKPLFSPAVISRRSTPNFSMSPVKPKPSISTPMLPTMLALSTNMLSVAAAM
jgi:hypothetical protein